MPGYQVPITTVDANTMINGGYLVTTNNQIGKNMIINGAMEIDQRWAGASYTPATNVQFSVDRWMNSQTQNSKFSMQRNAGSVTPPLGFTNYLGITTVTATTVGTGDTFGIFQRIEGYNFSQAFFGTPYAKSVTLSFWVRSSIAGTFTVTLQNGVNDRCNVVTYNISSPNSWEYKTITFPGDTTGTWEKTTSIGAMLMFDLGTGTTTYGTTPNTGWQSYIKYGSPNSVKIVETSGATFYLTGVQLEIGTQATPFSRAGGTISGELINCQRYYEKSYKLETALQTNTTVGINQNTDAYYGTNTTQGTRVNYRVEKRAIPTVATYRRDGSATNPNYWAYYTNATMNYAAFSVDGGSSSTNGFLGWFNGTATAITNGWANSVVGHWTADAEL